MTMLQSKTHTPLDRQACLNLATKLGESPRTAMSHNTLVNGHGVAFALGNACLIEPNFLPGEPAGFAPDARSLWALLRQIEGWYCVLADTALAQVLGLLVERENAKSVRYYTGLIFELAQPIVHASPNVRLLTQEDLPLVLAASELSSIDETQHCAQLRLGLQAGAIVGGRLVALANVDSPIGRYAEISVVTIEAYRNRGYSTAAASLVVQSLQSQGRSPLWSCGESNAASTAVARKLGFVERDRMTYVIPAKS